MVNCERKPITNLIFAMIAIFVFSTNALAGGFLFVDDDAAAGRDGTSWETAYRFLQDALSDASNGGIGEIHIAQGTYKPDRDEANPVGTGDREATFHLLNGVALMGGYAGIGAKDPDARDIELFETILSGDLSGNDEPNFVNYDENSYHVTMGSDNDNTSLLEGFTITAGNANGIEDPEDRGGGLYASSTDATITFCKFEANFCTGGGGGVFSRDGSLNMLHSIFIGNKAGDAVPATAAGMAIIATNSESLRVEGCTFTGNTATSSAGGLWITSGSTNPATIINCTFENNTVTGPAGGNFASGAGGMVVFFAHEDMVIQDCIFSNNTVSNPDAASVGGGLVLSQGSGLVVNCQFLGNSTTSGITSLGGGIQIQAGNPILVNCLVAGNSSELGSGISNILSGVNATYIDCTFTENTSAKGGGAFYGLSNSEALIINCILWNNGQQPVIVDEGDSVTTLNYSDIQGGWAGAGSNNIDADPMFVNPGSGDYRLSSGSPCIDAGHNWHVPVDANDYDQDGILCELLPVDLDGNPRFNADEVDFDTGCGVPVVVDMGAYEYQFDPADQITFADLNGDNAVNTSDLLDLFADWGDCAKGCCLADLDLDGTINTIDLLILFANWGTCE